MSPAVSSTVIWSLEGLRERVKQRLARLPEYRGFLAIEEPIAEVAEIPDLLAHLETAKHKILDRLKLTREYQALLTMEKAIKEISEVLEVVGEEESIDAAPLQAATPAPLPKAPVETPHEVGVVSISALVQEFSRHA